MPDLSNLTNTSELQIMGLQAHGVHGAWFADHRILSAVGRTSKGGLPLQKKLGSVKLAQPYLDVGVFMFTKMLDHARCLAKRNNKASLPFSSIW